MSTKSELSNPKSFLRKVNRNNKTLTINIPLKIAERHNIHAEDYMIIEEYEDQRNKLTLRKLNINTEEKGDQNE